MRQVKCAIAPMLPFAVAGALTLAGLFALLQHNGFFAANGTGDEAASEGRTNGDQPGLPNDPETSPIVGEMSLPNPVPDALRLRFMQLSQDSPGTGTDFRFVPGSNEILMTLREGKLAWLELSERSSHVKKVWDFPESMIFDDACGPSNVLLDQEFDENKFIYVTYCESRSKNRLVRYVFDESDGPVSPSPIFELDSNPDELWRRFGSLGWESAGVMWVLIGDHGFSQRAQEPDSLYGKLALLRPNRQPSGQGVLSEPVVQALGFRAPWRATRDEQGWFFIADVGDEDFEEINLVSKRGQNFGWDLYTGPCRRGCEGSKGPLVHYGRGNDHRYVVEEKGARENESRSIWVGQIYQAPRIDRYAGLMNDVVAFGDMFTGMIRGIKVDAAARLVYDEPIGALSFVTQWRVGPDGYIYVLDLGGHLHVALLASK